MTSYTGICLVGDKSSGRVTDVQVRDTGGNEIPLPLDEYIRRGIQPPYTVLPWCGENREGGPETRALTAKF